MSKQTLEKIITPPFKRIDKTVWDANKKLLFEVPDFLLCEDTVKVLDFTVAAMTEKWERDHKEN